MYCLLVVEEVFYQFKLKIGKLNEDLLQPSGIRYEVLSFSVRHFISIAYWENLIFGVKLSVVVPQAIGISLRNITLARQRPSFFRNQGVVMLVLFKYQVRETKS